MCGNGPGTGTLPGTVQINYRQIPWDRKMAPCGQIAAEAGTVKPKTVLSPTEAATIPPTAAIIWASDQQEL